MESRKLSVEKSHTTSKFQSQKPTTTKFVWAFELAVFGYFLIFYLNHPLIIETSVFYPRTCSGSASADANFMENSYFHLS